MKRLYVELEVPDNVDANPIDAFLTEVAHGNLTITRARWYPMGYDVPNALTHVGWLNPTSGALHRNKMDLHPGPDWARVFLYDPAQFAQVDGGKHCATLAEALRRATWKVSFNLHTGERVRLVRQDMNGEVAFVLRPFVDDLRDELVARGVSAEVAGSLARMADGGWEQSVLDGGPGAVGRVAGHLAEALDVAEVTMSLDDPD